MVSLSAIERFALKLPVALGANVTAMMHEAPDAALVEQVVWPALIENRAGLVPVIVSLVMLSAEAPVFVSVSGKVAVGCGCLELIFKLPKFRAAGMSLTIPFTSVIVALADLVLSVADVAVIVTLAFAGTVAGAAYTVAVPLAVVAKVTVPHTSAVHTVPFCVSVQLTLTCALESLFTVGVNGVAFSAAVAPTGMIALAGDTATVMAGTVMLIEPVWVVSESEVATIMTFRSFAGGLAGAV